jgi:hypothetical protein
MRSKLSLVNIFRRSAERKHSVLTIEIAITNVFNAENIFKVRLSLSHDCANQQPVLHVQLFF